MRLLDPTYISQNCDYSFGDESGMQVGGFMKPANANNSEFMDYCKSYRRLRSEGVPNIPSFITLFIDNLRLYRREGIKYTALEQLHTHMRNLKDEKVRRFANEDLLKLCASMPDIQFLIFTGFEDTPTDEFIFDKIPDNVIAIYASNAITFGGKVKPMFYGIQRKISPDDERQDVIMRFLSNPIKPSKLLYINHSLSTNPVIREAINNHFIRIIWATVRHPTNYQTPNYTKYLEDIKQHKFMICPSGNAIGCECHRDIETLYMRRVPVVEWSPYLEYIFKGVPVLFVDSFLNLTEELLIESDYLYDEMQTFDFSKLDIEVFYKNTLYKYTD